MDLRSLRTKVVRGRAAAVAELAQHMPSPVAVRPGGAPRAPPKGVLSGARLTRIAPRMTPANMPTVADSRESG
eukprot:scaffold2848_cov30-Tisochrysis_lutea.AAC.2